MKKILLVGDSISLYYNPFLARFLAEKAELHTKKGRQLAFSDLDRPTGGNGGDSSMVLTYLKERDAMDDLDFDLFVFNCGLHDIKRMEDDTCQISETEYEKNLTEIVMLMYKHQIKTVFITSTPVEDARHNAHSDLGFTRYHKDICHYNQLALKIMKTRDIPVIDLGSFTAGLGEELYMDHVHFVEPVRKLQAAFIAGALENILSRQ